VLDIQLEQHLGFPLRFTLTEYNDVLPCQWSSYNSEEEVYNGEFLQDPGLKILHYNDPQFVVYTQGIPLDILTVIRSFEIHQFAALQVCARLPYAQQLCISHPVLFLLIINFSIAHQLSQHEVQDLLLLKNTYKLQKMLFHSGKNSLKFLSKIRYWILSDRFIRLIQEILRSYELLDLIKHQNIIEERMLNAFMLYPNFRLHNALACIFDSEIPRNISHMNHLLTDIVTMSRITTIPLPRRFRNYQHLNQFHDRLIIQINQMPDHIGYNGNQRMAQHLSKPMLKQPLPNGKYVHAITTWKDLKLEGKHMHHCVYSYHWRIHKGEYYIYHFSHNEELTIGITMNAQLIMISQIKGRYNGAPEAESVELINQWFTWAMDRNTAES
jgi:hypothetical protein